MNAQIFFLPISTRPHNLPPLPVMKGNFWHTGIMYNGKVYECFDHGKSLVGDCDKERMDLLHAMQVIIVDAPIDEKKLVSEIDSGPSCSEYVARVVGLSHNAGAARECWPQDVYNYLTHHVSFALDKKLDKEMALEFLDTSAGGVDFTQGIIGLHPELVVALGKGKKEQARIINAYFDMFYDAHEAELEEVRLAMEKEWRADEEAFFAAAEKIFGDVALNGCYTCYISAIDCNPRFLDRETFQIFYKHSAGASYVVAHELLHFLFFGRMRARHADLFSHYGSESGPLWDISELFDNAVMMSPDFMGGKYAADVHCYPDHVHYLSAVRDVWERSRDVDKFIVEMFGRLTA